MDTTVIAIVAGGMLLLWIGYMLLAKLQDREIASIVSSPEPPEPVRSFEEVRQRAEQALATAHVRPIVSSQLGEAWEALAPSLRQFFTKYGVVSFDTGETFGELAITYIRDTDYKQRIRKAHGLDEAIIIGADDDGDIFVSNPGNETVYMVDVYSTVEKFPTIYHLIDNCS